jgi:hypothetical protein
MTGNLWDIVSSHYQVAIVILSFLIALFSSLLALVTHVHQRQWQAKQEAQLQEQMTPKLYLKCSLTIVNHPSTRIPTWCLQIEARNIGQVPLSVVTLPILWADSKKKGILVPNSMWLHRVGEGNNNYLATGQIFVMLVSCQSVVELGRLHGLQGPVDLVAGVRTSFDRAVNSEPIHFDISTDYTTFPVLPF